MRLPAGGRPAPALRSLRRVLPPPSAWLRCLPDPVPRATRSGWKNRARYRRAHIDLQIRRRSRRRVPWPARQFDRFPGFPEHDCACQTNGDIIKSVGCVLKSTAQRRFHRRNLRRMTQELGKVAPTDRPSGDDNLVVQPAKLHPKQTSQFEVHFAERVPIIAIAVLQSLDHAIEIRQPGLFPFSDVTHEERPHRGAGPRRVHGQLAAQHPNRLGAQIVEVWRRQDSAQQGDCVKLDLEQIIVKLQIAVDPVQLMRRVSQLHAEACNLFHDKGLPARFP